jgi:hypothetical protein
VSNEFGTTNRWEQVKRQCSRTQQRFESQRQRREM